MIRAIIFDYFGVICSDEYWKLVKADKNVSSDFLDIANRVNLGKVTWVEFMKHIAQRTGKTFEEIKNMYESEQINPQIVELIHQLRGKYKIGLITNAHHEFLEPILATTGLDKLFDSIVISSRVGYIKPDKHIFELALGELDVEPSEVILIDDIERNVAGAEAAGLIAVHYRSLNQFKADLGQLLR